MESDPAGAGAGAAPSTQAGRMRAAIDQAVAVGPSFLRGEIDADQMANTMLRAVADYVAQEEAAGGDGPPYDAEVRALHHVLSELRVCGSGYLEGLCDAACVARTMTEVVREFSAG
ncbi:MAG TPA: hypothetical protein VF299_06145 [Mycobacterium sp.]